MAPPHALVTRSRASVAQLRKLLDQLLRFLPTTSLVGRTLKYAALLVLAVNARSFPGMWHVRLWAPVYAWYIRQALHGNDQEFLELNCPIGRTPFESIHVMPGLATLDDCDMFGHLSNSSYAKTLDIARFQTFIKFVVPWYAEQGNTLLGGSHYAFFKEIPIMARFEMRTCLGAWDHKWIYLVTYFVSYPARGSKAAAALRGQKPLIPPSPLPRALLPEGALLHCVAVSRYCFKQKRLTVPPTVALAMSGFGGTEALGRRRWERKELLKKEGRLHAVVNGAWKEEIARPTEEGGFALEELEELRKRGMEMCGKIMSGMDGLKAIASV